MTARIDLSGQRFGRWMVGSHAGGKRWNCRCDCGTERAVDGGSLRRGISAGCNTCAPSRANRRTHGQKRSRLYSIWCGMKARCSNAREPAFERYGGRGIRVCKAWAESFEAFRDWALANGYEPHLTIDRENNDGHYEPGNCRWATNREQNRNYSRNRPIQYAGRYVLIGDLAAERGLPADIVKNRVRRYGWPIERALSTPVMSRGGVR